MNRTRRRHAKHRRAMTRARHLLGLPREKPVETATLFDALMAIWPQAETPWAQLIGGVSRTIRSPFFASRPFR